MSRTGNRGFTFLEVMVSAAALAMGAVLVYEAFFISLDAFSYYADYLTVASWADDRIWDAGDRLRRAETPPQQDAGEFTSNNKVFRWALNYNLLDEQAHLYSIDLFLSWKAGKKEFILSRNTYGVLQQK